MKAYILPAAIISLTLSSPLALAAGTDTGHQMHHPSSTGQPTADRHIKRMEDHLKEMRVEMTEIRQLKDPKEQKKRLDAHMRGMMKMMLDMRENGSMMAQGGMEGATMEERMAGMMKHQALMEKRMEMMQALMEQMLQNQALSNDVFLDDILRDYDS